MPSAAAPPVAKKPVFTPSTSSTGRSFNPLVAARNRRNDNVDADGWGADAPPVTRSQLEKVESAYKPTKVNLAELTKQPQEPSRFNGSSRDDTRADVVRGAYQPVGKVDIAAIRAAAQNKEDFRPAPVKGSYEPVGKVDIAAIRAKAQNPAESAEEEEAPRPSLAERSSAFNQSGQSERLTSLPKPKVAKKFGGAGAFTGTKAPAPGGLGFGGPAAPTAPPVGAASRTFADEGGKTPAQLWAEKKARERGESGSGSALPPPATSPVTAQKSGGEWKSGYAGKSWNVQAPAYGRSITGQQTGDTDQSTDQARDEPTSPSGGVSALKDRFKQAPPMGAPSIPRDTTGASDQHSAPPPPDMSTRPSGGFALPGLPSRPAAADEEDEDTRSPEREESPIRVAMPVPRVPEPEIEPAEKLPERPIPVPQDLPKEDDLEDEQESHNMARGAATSVAQEAFGQAPVHDSQTAASGGKSAIIEYDYDKAEDNEVDLKEGEYVTNIEMVDDDWWMGTNSQGESGLFPSNYVTLVEDDASAAGGHSPAPPPAESESAAAGGGATATATALFDYEAAEDNGEPHPNYTLFSREQEANNVPRIEFWRGRHDHGP